MILWKFIGQASDLLAWTQRNAWQLADMFSLTTVAWGCLHCTRSNVYQRKPELIILSLQHCPSNITEDATTLTKPRKDGRHRLVSIP